MANIPTVTAILTQTESSQPWSHTLGIRTVVQNLDNPLYPRNIMLDQNTVTIQRPGFIFGITIEALIAVAIQYVPQLSWPPVITLQPVNDNESGDDGSSFGLTATSELGGVTYQWQVSSNGGASFSNLSNGGVYSNVTTDNMGISVNNGLGNNQYRCNVTNASGTTTSQAAALILDPFITSQPSNVTVAHPAAASFSVTVTGAGTLTYQWQHSTDGGATWSNLSNSGVYSNVTTTTMNISDSTGLNGNKFRCKVTDSTSGSPTSTSSAATLTVT